MQAFVSLHDVVRKFGDFVALDGVNMDIHKGLIHAVLGENGAGKTTLMNIIYGLYQPTSGEVRINGEPTILSSPRDALHHHIGMIHQHFMLVDSLTVTENIILGLEGLGANIDYKEHSRKIAALSEEYGFDVEPDKEIWRLSMGMRQRVEILKVLYRDVDLLILDEPTSVLAPPEVETFLDGLSKLRAKGKTVVFITHKLDEVMTVSDDITVMRHGRITESVQASNTTQTELARSMMGRDLHAGFTKTEVRTGKPLLRVENASVVSNQGINHLSNVSLEVKAGEILGVAGVDGNGQDELADAVSGMIQLSEGEIFICDKPVSKETVDSRRHDHRLGYVPADRHGTALVMDYSVALNGALRDFARPPNTKFGLMQLRVISNTVKDWIERYDVRLHSINQAIRFLSGGNQQKLVFAREIETGPEVLLVVQPCKGLDVGAIENVQKNVLALREAGKAVLYISTELEHIMEVADRIAVMCEGKVTGVLKTEEATSERVGMLMAGIREHA